MSSHPSFPFPRLDRLKTLLQRNRPQTQRREVKNDKQSQTVLQGLSRVGSPLHSEMLHIKCSSTRIFSGEALETGIHLVNRCPSSAIEFKTPI